MPTIPNFLNTTSPLGNAFKGLASVLMSQPSDSEQMLQGAQYDMARTNAQKAQQEMQQGADQTAARGKLGSLIADPRLYDNTFRPNATPAPAELGDMGVDASPINKAFRPDMGQILSTSMAAGYKPEELGKLLLVGAANGSGARSDITQNAQVGSGEGINSTFGAFDTTEANKVGMNDADNMTSRANNAANNAQSDKNNRRTIAAENARATAVPQMDDDSVSYAAEIYRRTGQMPALGMGAGAAKMRAAIVSRAASLEKADGRTGADAAIAFAENQGNRATARTLGTREANAGMAVNELQNFLPVAKSAVADLSRTGFLPVDKIYEMYQSNTNDPHLAKAHAALVATENAYARAISPNGVPTDQSRATAHDMLRTARSPESLNATLDQMMVEAQAALKSPEQTREQMRANMRGAISGKASAGAPAGPEKWHRDQKTGKLVKGN